MKVIQLCNGRFLNRSMDIQWPGGGGVSSTDFLDDAVNTLEWHSEIMCKEIIVRVLTFTLFHHYGLLPYSCFLYKNLIKSTVCVMNSQELITILPFRNVTKKKLGFIHALVSSSLILIITSCVSSRESIFVALFLSKMQQFLTEMPRLTFNPSIFEMFVSYLDFRHSLAIPIQLLFLFRIRISIKLAYIKCPLESYF